MHTHAANACTGFSCCVKFLLVLIASPANLATFRCHVYRHRAEMYAKTSIPVNGHVCIKTINRFTVAIGELDATKANAANLVAQLQVETASKQ